MGNPRPCFLGREKEAGPSPTIQWNAPPKPLHVSSASSSPENGSQITYWGREGSLVVIITPGVDSADLAG